MVIGRDEQEEGMMKRLFTVIAMQISITQRSSLVGFGFKANKCTVWLVRCSHQPHSQRQAAAIAQRSNITHMVAKRESYSNSYALHRV